MKHFRPYNLDQRLLLAPDLREWLPKDHLASFVSDVVEEMDLSALLKRMVRQDGRGGERYHPAMLLKLLIYGYCIGRTSSRRIETATYDEVAFRVLSGDQHPDHDTIADFRRQYLMELAALFVQVLELCQKAGLVKLGHVSLDGTKIKANASKHKAMSYGRMSAAEHKLEEQVKALLAEAEHTDSEEDARYGKGKRIDELPEELRTRTARLSKIREAKAALEREAKDKAKQQAEEAKRKNKERQGKPGKKHTVPEVQAAKPEDKAQRNFTDPESRIMLDGASKAFVQGYNSQIVVDSAHQVIVALDVVQQSNDKQQLVPMLEAVHATLGVNPQKLSADAGYFSDAAIAAAEASGVQLFVPPDRHKHGAELPASTGTQTRADRMREKLRTDDGHDIYKMRKAIVEPVFGQIKEARGFRRFSLRGLQNVRGEWALVCLAHNLLKLFKYGAGQELCAA